MGDSAYYMRSARIDEIRPLLEAHHYLGGRCADPIRCFALRMPGGLFGDMGEPVAGIIYTSPANRYFGDGAIELSRLVRAEDMNEPLSRFVAWSLRWLRKNTSFRFCVSYADSGAGHHGGIYQACNLIYVGEGVAKPFYVNPETGQRISARSYDQSGEKYRRGLIKQSGTKKFRYVLPLSEKWESIQARFGWEKLPYPKPDDDNRHGSLDVVGG